MCMITQVHLHYGHKYTCVWACYTTLWSHMFTHILPSSAISAFYAYIATRKAGWEGSGNKARTVVIA